MPPFSRCAPCTRAFYSSRMISHPASSLGKRDLDRLQQAVKRAIIELRQRDEKLTRIHAGSAPTTT